MTAVLLACGTPLLEEAVRAVEAGGCTVAAVLVDRRYTERRWPGLDARWAAVLGSRGIQLAAEQSEVTASGLVLLSCLYTRRVGPRLLEGAVAAVNVHPGPLPALRGLRVLEYAILADLRVYAVTAHLMTEAYDEGPILESLPVAIDPHDTVGELAARAHRACLDLLGRVAGRLAALGPESLRGTDQHGPSVMADSRCVEALLEPSAADDDETLLRKLRAACWDGETAVVRGREVTVDRGGVSELRGLLGA